jgi:hypothetical protein
MRVRNWLERVSSFLLNLAGGCVANSSGSLAGRAAIADFDLVNFVGSTGLDGLMGPSIWPKSNICTGSVLPGPIRKTRPFKIAALH